jgi:multicomponent Na+:H+ antiporter subunit E
MSMFLWNILLALFWGAVEGGFTVTNLAGGFVVAFLILYLLRGVVGSASYCAKVPRVLGFLVFYLGEIVRSNLRIAYEVLTPRFSMRPGVIGLELDAATDLEIFTLASLITMTPGTLSLDVSSDRKMLYIHSMYVEDAEALKRTLKDDLERRVLAVLR